LQNFRRIVRAIARVHVDPARKPLLGISLAHPLPSYLNFSILAQSPGLTRSEPIRWTGSPRTEAAFSRKTFEGMKPDPPYCSIQVFRTARELLMSTRAPLVSPACLPSV